MRAIPSEFDPGVVALIDDRLDEVTTAYGVSLLLAIESGSRAWGFPSPDSDYDCRFIFVRTAADYAALWPPRDVIETPLDVVLDVNGWDLAKALRLLVKGNATPLEWLRSPIVYRGDPGASDRLLTLAESIAPRELVLKHHLHLGRRHLEGSITMKRLLYAVRPAVAVRWLRDRPEASVPPMHLPTLLDESSVPDTVRDAARTLIEQKQRARETTLIEPSPALLQFVRNELAESADDDAHVSPERVDLARRQAQSYFLQELGLA